MIFSRILSILAVTMTLTVLPSLTHGYDYDCEDFAEFKGLIPAECKAEGQEFDVAAQCIEDHCMVDFYNLMPYIHHFLEDAENTNIRHDCYAVNTFMEHMIDTCGSCTESLVRFVDCAAEYETAMVEDSKKEIQTFINILKQQDNNIGIGNANEILEFIDKEGSCQALIEDSYVIQPPTSAPTPHPTPHPTPAPTKLPTPAPTKPPTQGHPNRLFDSLP